MNTFKDSENLFITGDNLEALKLLQESYLGKIDMIYIDPPYNTGKDFVYHDNFKSTQKDTDVAEGSVDEDGNRLVKNEKNSGRYHSDWLSMMYPRLKLARNLLSDSGVIFVSIDENEIGNLKMLLDAPTLFGEVNYVGDIVRKTRSSANDSGTGFNQQHEYVLIYAKSISAILLHGEEKNKLNYKNPDADPLGRWISDNPSARSGGPNSSFKITNPKNGHVDEPPAGRYWAFSKATFDEWVVSGKVLFKNNVKDGQRGFIIKKYLSELKSSFNTVNSLFGSDNEYMNQVATKYVRDELFKGDNIYQLSGEVESYKAGFVVSAINATNQFVEFTNGIKLHVGEVIGNANDDDLRRIQIRETINSHLSKEASLFKRGIKTLSLFFIDEVVKYKDYDAVDDKGAYALMFEEEYESIVRDRLTDTLLDPAYRTYLEREINTPDKVHAGYFSVDKKGKSIDSKIKRGSEASDDISAYGLIMKNKERLLSFDEPVRFIFSHSALKEGWDNPNVFQIATLRQSSSDIKKRQEIGRGLRLSVNQNGDRQDAQSLGEGEVQQVNVITVIANESYENFARDLQSELAEAVKNRPKFVEPKLFEGRELVAKNASDQTVSSMTVDNAQAAEIWASLKANGIITKEKQTSDSYKEMSVDEQIAAIKASLDDDYQAYVLPIQELVNSVYDPQSVPIEP
ncbi:DNA methyltransferase [Leuconostoc pseudomesenteroides]|uniref:DNA methyltransferase n=1 Tax=Leuconostoc pseudomesenteroides TaxID=33968 RepID=UPI00345EADB8